MDYPVTSYVVTLKTASVKLNITLYPEINETKQLLMLEPGDGLEDNKIYSYKVIAFNNIGDTISLEMTLGEFTIFYFFWQ